MKSFVILVLFVMAASNPCAAMPEKVDITAKDVAGWYFEALMTGNVEMADAHSTVPFSFDRKKVIANKEDLEKEHRRILADKGKRKVPNYTIAPTDKAPVLDPKTFPAHTVFRIDIDGEFIDIYVTKKKPLKVIGFSD